MPRVLCLPLVCVSTTILEPPKPPPGSPSHLTQRWPITVVGKPRSHYVHRYWGIIGWIIWIKLNFLPFQYCFRFFLNFPREGKTNFTEELVAPGKSQASLCLFLGRGEAQRALGEARNQKASVFFSDNSGPTYLPLVSLAAQQVSAPSPSRWRRRRCRAVNPTEWLPLSGQELSRKSFQALRTAASCWVLISLHPGL